jgi:hypothetical protein
MAAAFAASSIYLAGQLSAAQDELDQVTLARSADEAKIRQLEAEVRRLGSASSRATHTTATVQPHSLAHTGKADGPPPPGTPAPPPVDRPSVAETPASENNRRQNQVERLRRRYAGMPEALGLDVNQADALYNLLANSRASAYEGIRAYEGDPVGRQAIQDAARAQRDADIEALLGPEKAAEFQSFEKSIPARMQVNRIGESLAASNVPLSADQRDSLIVAVAAEQRAKPAPEQIPNPTPDYEAQFLDWQADYSRRVQARIEPLLSAGQLASYREAVEVQNARRAEQRARVERRRNPSDDRQ